MERARRIVGLIILSSALGHLPDRARTHGPPVFASVFTMKFFSSKVLIYALLLPLAGMTMPGCSKIKALVTKKPLQPVATPADSPLPGAAPVVAPAGTTVASKSAVAPASAPAAATPARPASAAINKSAAVMVLCYHRLEPKPRPKDPLAITPDEFEKEMQALKDNNFSVIPMQDFLAWRRGDKDIPSKCAVITIDDGYVSGYDTAWPILKKFGYPFTMFVYINYINSGGKSISWDQLAEMRDAGVDIESHTYSHADLRNPNDKYAVDKHNFELIQNDVKTLGEDGWLRKEIVDSKAVLEKQLGIKVNALAYPFGKYNEKVRAIVKAAGYEAAFTVYGQRIGYSAPPYDLLGRYAVDQNDPKIFKDALSMTGGGSGGAPPALSSMAQMASASMITQPMQGETISNPKPLIKANLATMGEIDPSSVKMRVSGIGAVNAHYDAATKTVSYQVAQTLEKNVTVIISATVGGRPAETRWDFTCDPSKAGQPVGKP